MDGWRIWFLFEKLRAFNEMIFANLNEIDSCLNALFVFVVYAIESQICVLNIRTRGF